MYIEDRLATQDKQLVEHGKRIASLEAQIRKLFAQQDQLKVYSLALDPPSTAPLLAIVRSVQIRCPKCKRDGTIFPGPGDTLSSCSSCHSVLTLSL